MINVGSEIIVGGTILQKINVGVWTNVGGNFYIRIETWYFWSTLYFNIWHCTYQVLHTLFKAVKCSSSSSNSFWRWNFLTQIFNQNWENFIIQNVTNSIVRVTNSTNLYLLSQETQTWSSKSINVGSLIRP